MAASRDVTPAACTHLQAAAARVDVTLAQHVSGYRPAADAARAHLAAAAARADAVLTEQCSGYRPWQLLVFALAAAWLLPRLVSGLQRQTRLLQDKGRHVALQEAWRQTCLCTVSMVNSKAVSLTHALPDSSVSRRTRSDAVHHGHIPAACARLCCTPAGQDHREQSYIRSCHTCLCLLKESTSLCCCQPA